VSYPSVQGTTLFVIGFAVKRISERLAFKMYLTFAVKPARICFFPVVLLCVLKQGLEIAADAIINVRYMTTSVVGSAAELLVYGTSVKLSE
jgi:hypothetical protein